MAKKSKCPEIEYLFINGLIDGSSTNTSERVVEGLEGLVSAGMQNTESESDDLRSLSVNNYYPDEGKGYGGCGCMI